MPYDSGRHFSHEDLETVARLFAQQRLFGTFSVQHADGLNIVVRLEILLKPPLPRWVKLLAAVPAESLGPRRP